LSASFLLALAALPGCGERPSAPAFRSAVLITVDTFRAGALGAGGHPRVRTPNLDRFFRTAVQYAQAFSPSPTTLSSHTSILTGAWPTRHGVLRNLEPAPPSLLTLPEQLLDAGFRTGAFVSSVALDPRLGLAQGFEVYDFQATRQVELDQPWRPAGRTLRRAAQWWTNMAGDRRFLWVHLFEPHFPYEPPEEFVELYDPHYRGHVRGDMDTLLDLWDRPESVPARDREHLRAMYLAEISGLDRKMGEFLGTLEEDPETAVVIVADHGESLGEHDLHFKHGPHVYPADVAVPLAVRGSGLPAAVVPSLVRTIDIPATLAELLHVPARLPEEAEDLLQWRDRAGPGLPVFGMASMPWQGPDARRQVQRVLRTPSITYVETPWRARREWFDRVADPGELVPRDPEERDLKALQQALRNWAKTTPDAGSRVEDPDLIGQLESLGYTD
jgi:arylsulfatase A-like enzyme